MPFLFFFAGFLFSTSTFVQAQDFIPVPPEKLYQRALAGSQQLFNGTEYRKYKSFTGEHPFFESDQYIVGRLKYDGVDYEAVPLYFDIAKDVLVTPYYFDGTWMAFISELVTEFEIRSHRFRFIKESINGLPGAGFYEILYSGNISLLSRHSKRYEETIDGMEVIHQFRYNREYFLLRNGEAFKLNENEKMPSILKDKKSELRTYIRKNPNPGLTDLIRYYDQLK